MENSTHLDLSSLELEGSNSTNTSLIQPLDCPQISNETDLAIETFAYWVEGVLLCVIAVPGIAGNALSSYILVRIIRGSLPKGCSNTRKLSFPQPLLILLKISPS